MTRPKLIKNTWLMLLVLVLIMSSGGIPVFAHGGQGTRGAVSGSSEEDQAVRKEYDPGDCANIANARERQRCYKQEGRYAVVAQQEENCDEISNPRERQRCRMRQQGGSR